MDTKQFAVETVLAEIRARWGQRIIRPASELTTQTEVVPTGIPPLDSLLGGGILVGKITALVGIPTSGITTLAYRLVASVHRQQGEAVYLDMSQTFNGAYAASCGVDTQRLLVARPPADTQGLALLRDIISSHVVRLVVVDWNAHTIPASLQRLQANLATSPTALVILNPTPTPYSHARLQVKCQGWLRDARDVVGCHLQVSLDQHPTLPTGSLTHFDLFFGEGLEHA